MYFFLALLFATHASAQPETRSGNAVNEQLRLRAVEVLRDTLANEEQWVKVHAAEQLLSLRYVDGVVEAFQSELERHVDEPQYRIGIWRVLARGAAGPQDRDQWIDRIRSARVALDGPDRLHATETLAKLNYVANADEIPRLEQDARSDDGPMAAFALCILVHSGRTEYEADLAGLLRSEDERTRLCAAYSLRHIEGISQQTLSVLDDVATHETEGSTARAYVLSSLLYHVEAETTIAQLKRALEEYVTNGTTAEKTEALAALGERGDERDLPLLMESLDDSEADVRAAAAYSILRIGRRVPHLLGMLDWAVIAVYFALMLTVGWYYSRRTSTEEEYMLGGRTMNPITVGFSMFASLLSTLTYLSFPGEMMKHGPMIVAQYLVFPLIFLVIGFVLIPVIMKQKVSSAYEILEINLGSSVRILGAVFFLLLRFMWMALIIYATSSKVLIPLLQLDPSYTPVVCIVLGVITISYTSMGGLRAVVMSDVIQTAVLFGGAILAVVLITVNMGGVRAWWPTEWSPHWDPVKVMYDPSARITVAGAMTSAFVWYICTAGSDQVAIQRYLATRDVRSARRVMMTSLSTDILVGLFLSMLGLALWSYFQANPQMLPDKYASLQNADVLFPRYISLGLPAGISGLVIAGLLAAAMSSLSSGVNSSSLVITVDFIERFGKGANAVDEKANLRRAKWVTVFVGVSVIILSIAAGSVGGNLLEVVFKVVNLLVAPLFVLFFMALFIPWATSLGAIVAGLSSVAMAVAIAYGGFMGLSFIWIMPMALLVGVVVGPAVSLIPIPKRTGVS